jgi:hypothetical protein
VVLNTSTLAHRCRRRGVHPIINSRPLRSRLERRTDNERAVQRGDDQAQKHPQPSEDEAQVVADGGEDGVGGITGNTLEIAAAQMALSVTARAMGNLYESYSTVIFNIGVNVRPRLIFVKDSSANRNSRTRGY